MESVKDSLKCDLTQREFGKGDQVLEGLKLIPSTEPRTYSALAAPIVIFPASLVKSAPLQYSKTLQHSKIANVEIHKQDFQNVNVEYLI